MYVGEMRAAQQPRALKNGPPHLRDENGHFTSGEMPCKGSARSVLAARG